MTDLPPIRLVVRVTPRASSNAVVRYDGTMLFLRLTAPPVEGAANAVCCAFVADLLGLRPVQATVRSGHKSRDKVLEITGLPEGDLWEKLKQRTGNIRVS